MKKLFITILCLSLLAPVGVMAQTPAIPAATAATVAVGPQDPSVEQRLADLEAYMNNGARVNASMTNISSKVAGPGPGHNAFQMICAAQVLFMTLPGLALFYGGLVRAK